MPADEITHCPKCNTELLDYPEIGLYCPEQTCPVLDGWKLYKP